jgi:hypothetical protein
MKPIRLAMLLLAGAVLLPPPALADFTATATLGGDGESSSPGTGQGVVTFLAAKDELDVDITFANLTSPTATPTGVPGSAHIHFGGPRVEGPILFPFLDFPLGVTSGSFSTILTPSSLIPDPVDGINTFMEAVDAIEAGNTYINIHTLAFPMGEIRGQLAVPEPSTTMMIATGMLVFGLYGFWAARRRSEEGAGPRTGSLVA